MINKSIRAGERPSESNDSRESPDFSSKSWMRGGCMAGEVTATCQHYSSSLILCICLFLFSLSHRDAAMCFSQDGLWVFNPTQRLLSGLHIWMAIIGVNGSVGGKKGARKLSKIYDCNGYNQCLSHMFCSWKLKRKAQNILRYSISVTQIEPDGLIADLLPQHYNLLLYLIYLYWIIIKWRSPNTPFSHLG